MKRNLLILLTSTLLFSYALTGCGSKTVVSVNVENKENLHNTNLGRNNFIHIGNDLFYDSATRIVYIGSGAYYDIVYTAYYAPNGLPYKYNPETNTFEEIELTK